MLKKLFTLIAVLALVGVAIQPVKVKAQGLVEYALILVLAVVGPGETAEFHWLPQANQGDPQVPILTPGDDITFTIEVSNVGDSTCPSEVVTTTVESLSGLNTLVVEKIGEKLTINGQDSFLSETCNFDAPRTAYQVGIPFPPGLAASESTSESEIALQLPRARVLSYAITGQTGETRAFTVINNHLSSRFSSTPIF